ncbi:MAG TPA: ATP-binding protein [Kofleriaceae bacterium]
MGEPTDCHLDGPPRRIALTGGPGAGKTAVLELVRRALCDHVRVLPEAAGILFGGGFPRRATPVYRRAAQRAIFHVQRELEATADEDPSAIVVCDRGTIDGGAYWPGPGELWDAVGTTLEAELARYDVVIHLRVPSGQYNHQNPLRTEDALAALAIDERIATLWANHPHRFEVPTEQDFFAKAAHALRILNEQLPACCRAHPSPLLATPARMEHRVQ